MCQRITCRVQTGRTHACIRPALATFSGLVDATALWCPAELTMALWYPAELTMAM